MAQVRGKLHVPTTIGTRGGREVFVFWTETHACALRMYLAQPACVFRNATHTFAYFNALAASDGLDVWTRPAAAPGKMWVGTVAPFRVRAAEDVERAEIVARLRALPKVRIPEPTEVLPRGYTGVSWDVVLDADDWSSMFASTPHETATLFLTETTHSARRYTHNRSFAGTMRARTVAASQDATAALREKDAARRKMWRFAAAQKLRTQQQAHIERERTLDELKEAALERERQWVARAAQKMTEP